MEPMMPPEPSPEQNRLTRQFILAVCGALFGGIAILTCAVFAYASPTDGVSIGRIVALVFSIAVTAASLVAIPFAAARIARANRAGRRSPDRR
jgi:predicted transporter